MVGSRGKDELVILTTGGTIEKMYDEEKGALENIEPELQKRILTRLRLPHTRVRIYSVMNKDSLEMTDLDRKFLSEAIKTHMKPKCPVIVIHGTDTMAETAEFCLKKIKNLDVPVVFTGAMRPIGLEDSDALQNIVEAMMAAKLITPGIYISFHNRLFTIPGAKKSRELKTFIQD